jgi:hypothetical protein
MIRLKQNIKVGIIAAFILSSSILMASLTSNQTVYAKKSDSGSGSNDNNKNPPSDNNNDNPSTGDNNINPPSDGQTNPSPPPTDDKKKNPGDHNCLDTPDKCPPLPIVCPPGTHKSGHKCVINCPPGFKPKHGVCNKDIFITVHQKVQSVTNSVNTGSVSMTKACFDTIALAWNTGVKKGQDPLIDNFINKCLGVK